MNPGQLSVPGFALAAVSVLAGILVGILGTVLAVVLVLVLVLAPILTLVLILILVLIVHVQFPPYLFLRKTAGLAFPGNHDLSFALKITLTINPKTMAAVIPPAEACNPPVNTPRKPSSVMAFLTPLARV